MEQRFRPWERWRPAGFALIKRIRESRRARERRREPVARGGVRRCEMQVKRSGGAVRRRSRPAAGAPRETRPETRFRERLRFPARRVSWGRL